MIGLLESPDNIYTVNEMDDLHEKLLDLSIKSEYSLNLKPLKIGLMVCIYMNITINV